MKIDHRFLAVILAVALLASFCKNEPKTTAAPIDSSNPTIAELTALLEKSPDNDSLVAQILATGADATVYVGSPVTVVPFLSAAEHADLGARMVVLAPSPVYNPAIPKAIASPM